MARWRLRVAARYEVVVAVRVPRNVERELKRRAADDDRSLSGYLRRKLVAMTAVPGLESEPARRNDNGRADGGA